MECGYLGREARVTSVGRSGGRSGPPRGGPRASPCLAVSVLLIGAVLAGCANKRDGGASSGAPGTPGTPGAPGASGAPGAPVSPRSGSGPGEVRPAASLPAPDAKLPAFEASQLLSFAPIAEGVDKPVMDDVVRLGQMLYFDPRLSGGGDVACASCHDLGRAGADGQVISTGSKKQRGRLHTPTVLNAGGAFAQGWDARATTIEELVVPHVTDPSIMGMPDVKRVTETLESIPAYAAAFKKAFPDETPAISGETLGRALGGYTKRLFARARWDRYLAGDRSLLSETELSGVAMFVEAGCTSCHQGKYLGATQSQKLGIAKAWPPPAGTDPGRFEATKQEGDRGMFKVPTLRNVTRTAPYLHDGSVASLEEVVRLMARHQVGRELTDTQIGAIVAFLGTLTGDPPKELAAKPSLPAGGPKTPKPD